MPGGQGTIELGEVGRAEGSESGVVEEGVEGGDEGEDAEGEEAEEGRLVEGQQDEGHVQEQVRHVDHQRELKAEPPPNGERKEGLSLVLTRMVSGWTGILRMRIQTRIQVWTTMTLALMMELALMRASTEPAMMASVTTTSCEIPAPSAQGGQGRVVTCAARAGTGAAVPPWRRPRNSGSIRALAAEKTVLQSNPPTSHTRPSYGQPPGNTVPPGGLEEAAVHVSVDADDDEEGHDDCEGRPGNAGRVLVHPLSRDRHGRRNGGGTTATAVELSMASWPSTVR